jgi:membrane-bound lytic murein transglycosylase MltF
MRGMLAAVFLILLGQNIAVQAEPSSRIMSLSGVRNKTGDFDAMLKRRAIRILLPPSRTFFFLDKGEAFGLTAEIGRELEKWLNKRHGKKPYYIEVVFVPTRRDQLLQHLREGKGDIATGNLTITPGREAIVDFTKPWGSGAKEVLVTGPGAPSVATLADLGGRDLMVRKSSSYHEHLLEFNKGLQNDRHPTIKLIPADEALEDEDLLEMVGSGLLPWAIVDLHIAKLWAKIYPKLTVREDVTLHDDGAIAWAIRKDSPLLRKELDEFISKHNMDTDFGDGLRSQYLHDGKIVKNALAPEHSARLRELLNYFRTYGKKFSIDPYILVAQGFQESAFDQSLRMKSGAVGVMQMKPSTAREELGIPDIVRRAEDNIHSGAAYLHFIVEKYLSDPAITEQNKVLLALASYNAGPGALKRSRQAAVKSGYDPNVWFGNVEHGVAAVAGQEPVQYVSHIYKYFLAYSALLKSSKDLPAADASK